MSIPMLPPIPCHRGLAKLAARYDGFILDLWGLVHNGIAPYPGAVDCMRRLRAAGKPVVLLSNAPRSAGTVAAFLADIGVPPDSYDTIVTSGDVMLTALARRADPWHARLGRTYFYLGADRDAGMLDGLDYRPVDGIEAASFILNLGLANAQAECLDDYRPLLARSHALGLAMICGNPDLTVMRGDRVLLCAGALAQAYAEIGGDVAWHGKPHRPAYQACLTAIGMASNRRVLAIGDSFRTDIAGANRAGLDSLLAVGGIHVEDFGPLIDGLPDPAALAACCARAGVRPTGCIPALVW